MKKKVARLTQKIQGQVFSRVIVIVPHPSVCPFVHYMYLLTFWSPLKLLGKLEQNFARMMLWSYLKSIRHFPWFDNSCFWLAENVKIFSSVTTCSNDVLVVTIMFVRSSTNVFISSWSVKKYCFHGNFLFLIGWKKDDDEKSVNIFLETDFHNDNNNDSQFFI